MGFLLFESQTSWLCWTESPDTIDWRPTTNCWRVGCNLGGLGRLLFPVLRSHGYYASDPHYCWLICIMHPMFFLSSLHSQSAAVRNEHIYIYIYICKLYHSLYHYWLYIITEWFHLFPVTRFGHDGDGHHVRHLDGSCFEALGQGSQGAGECWAWSNLNALKAHPKTAGGGRGRWWNTMEYVFFFRAKPQLGDIWRCIFVFRPVYKNSEKLLKRSLRGPFLAKIRVSLWYQNNINIDIEV